MTTGNVKRQRCVLKDSRRKGSHRRKGAGGGAGPRARKTNSTSGGGKSVAPLVTSALNPHAKEITEKDSKRIRDLQKCLLELGEYVWRNLGVRNLVDPGRGKELLREKKGPENGGRVTGRGGNGLRERQRGKGGWSNGSVFRGKLLRRKSLVKKL